MMMKHNIEFFYSNSKEKKNIKEGDIDDVSGSIYITIIANIQNYL